MGLVALCSIEGLQQSLPSTMAYNARAEISILHCFCTHSIDLGRDGHNSAVGQLLNEMLPTVFYTTSSSCDHQFSFVEVFMWTPVRQWGTRLQIEERARQEAISLAKIISWIRRRKLANPTATATLDDLMRQKCEHCPLLPHHPCSDLIDTSTSLCLGLLIALLLLN